MKKQLLYIVLFAIVALSACNSGEGESPNIDIAAPVSIEPVNTGSLSRFTIATGNATAAKVIELNAQIGGKYILKNHPSYKRPYRLG